MERESGCLPQTIETEQVVEVLEESQFLDLAATLETRGEDELVTSSTTTLGERERREEEEGEETLLVMTGEKRKREAETILLAGGGGDGELMKRSKGADKDEALQLCAFQKGACCTLSSEDQLQRVTGFLGLRHVPLRELSSPALDTTSVYSGGRVLSLAKHGSYSNSVNVHCI